jgi:hypothetical protein
MPSITYPITLPDPQDLSAVEFTMYSIVAMSSSPFSGIQQVYRHPGQYWMGRMAVSPQPRESAERWLAFLASLYGRYGTFTAGDPKGGVSRGSAASAPGTPIISVASLNTDYFSIAGAPSSATGYLLPGDYVQVGTGTATRLHKTLEQVNTTSGGVATVKIWPMIKTPPASGATLVVKSCQGLWRLSSNSPTWSADNFLTGISFDIMEALTYP